jgi:hypothetical protein
VVRWEQRPEAWRIEVAWDAPRARPAPGKPQPQRLRLEPLPGGASWRVEDEVAPPVG